MLLLALVTCSAALAGCITPDEPTVTVLHVTGFVTQHAGLEVEPHDCRMHPGFDADLERRRLAFDPERYALDVDDTWLVAIVEVDVIDPFHTNCGEGRQLSVIGQEHLHEISFGGARFLVTYPVERIGTALLVDRATLWEGNALVLEVNELQGGIHYLGSVEVAHLGAWKWKDVHVEPGLAARGLDEA